MRVFLRYLRREALPGIFGILLGCLLLFPVFYGVMGAFKTPAEFNAYPPAVLPKSFSNLENFRAVFTQVPMPRYFLNSLITATLTSVVRLIVAALAAYAFAFYRFRGEKVLFILILGTMMLPADTLLITNYQTVSRLGLLDSYLGVCIVTFVSASQMFMLRQHFKSAPGAVREAAQLDGCGDLRFAVSILTPMSLPLMLILFVQSFVTQWNAYLWPLLVTNTNAMRTVQVGVTMLTAIEGTNYETVLAGATVAMIPAAILFVAMRRSLTRTMSQGAVIG